jgi:hypothetical protein
MKGNTMKHYYVIYTSDDGPLLKSFKSEKDRNKWCSKQDDTFESYIAVDCDGLIKEVFTPTIGS